MLHHRGIALIQVLIITMVLSILGLYILQSTRDQVNLTSTIQKSTELRLELENTEAEIINALLSNFKIQKINTQSPVASKWNFHNKPFDVGDVSVKIQDLNGLISLNITDNSMLEDLLTTLDVSGSDIREFTDSLSDWKDDNDLKRINGAERDYYEREGIAGPRNGYLQSMSEASYIKKGTILTEEQWRAFFTVERTSGFNPLSAPEKILLSLVKDDTKVAKIIKLRDNGQLTGRLFYNITLIEADEFVSYIAGSTLNVTMTAKRDEQQMIKKFTIKLRARSIRRPVVITNVMWNTNENK